MADSRPSLQRATEKYRRAAGDYDRRIGIRAIAPVRRRAVRRLQLRPGDTVIDVACGTGLNFASIIAAIGPNGRLIGADLSAEMLAIARQRVDDAGWSQVALVQSAVQDADLPGDADAALFSFTHDVLRTRAAVDRVVDVLRPGGRVVTAGPLAPPPWLAPVRPLLRRALMRYTTTAEGLEQPWSHLLDRVDIDRVERPRVYAGWLYVASGAKR